MGLLGDIIDDVFFNNENEVDKKWEDYKLEKEIDCFIIFFDLEYNDSLSELN